MIQLHAKIENFFGLGVRNGLYQESEYPHRIDGIRVNDAYTDRVQTTVNQ